MSGLLVVGVDRLPVVDRAFSLLVVARDPRRQLPPHRRDNCEGNDDDAIKPSGGHAGTGLWFHLICSWFNGWLRF